MTETETIYVKVADVIGNGTIRGSKEELQMLVESMRKSGQIQEIVIRENHEIVCGRRRLAAAKQLGWKRIRANIVTDDESEVEAEIKERDENTCRVEYTRKERLQKAREIEAKLRPQASKNQATSTGGKKPKSASGKLPKAEKVDVREKAAQAAGMSGRTLEKAQAVIDAAQSHPDRYADLGSKVSTDNHPIDPVHQEFRERQEIYDAADKDNRFAEIADRLTVTHDTEKAKAEYEKLRDEQSKDKTGQPLPRPLMRTFNDRWISECVAGIDGILTGPLRQVAKAVGRNSDWPNLPVGVSSCVDEAISMLESARDDIQTATPYAVCQSCGGDGCRVCGQAGWLTKEAWQKRKVGA